MDIDAARIFTKIIALGSFTSAAQHLNIPKPTVSRKITALEEELGVRLIERSTRQLRLTPSGERFLEYALKIIDEVDRCKREFQHIKEEPQGNLKIAMSPLVGDLHFQQILLAYMTKYPQVTLDVNHSYQQFDPIRDDIDIVIWIGKLPQNNFVTKWISYAWRMLYASPNYIKKHGAPKTLEELEQHRCIYSDRNPYWTIQDGSCQYTLHPESVLTTNSFWLARSAAIAGHGIGLFPVLLMGEDVQKNHLQHLMPSFFDVSEGIYAVFPSRRLIAPQVRAFLDLLDDYKDQNLLVNRSPNLHDPYIQNYLQNMQINAPGLKFNFQFSRKEKD